MVSGSMVLTIPTGRTPNEMVEVAPAHCPAGRPRGPRQVLVGSGMRPDGMRPDGVRPDGVRPDGVRARSWTCRTCGVIARDRDS
jgi:hypothetical protein